VNMKKMTTLDLCKRIFEEEKIPLSCGEIWEVMQQRGYGKEFGISGKKPWNAIGARLYTNIKDNHESLFLKVSSRPTRFFLKKLVPDGGMEKFQKSEVSKILKPKKLNFTERNLHPFLTYFAYTYFRVCTKTIFHEKSQKQKYAQWLHPDLVGVSFPVEEWEEVVLDFSREIGVTTIKMFSFELKKELNFSNLRESFFQAVSNSSWANEGYLVSVEIDKDEEFQFELKRLSSSFGIGIIRLDIKNPDDSEVLFSARCSDNLDWDTVNKLASGNSDFKTFLVRIKKDFTSKEIRKDQYDKVYEMEKLVQTIKS